MLAGIARHHRDVRALGDAQDRRLALFSSFGALSRSNGRAGRCAHG
jgi:hypothetical protein